MFNFWDESLRDENKIAEYVKRASEGEEEKILEVCEVETRAFLYTKRPWMHNWDLCLKNLFHTSLSETEVPF